jgi:hypothetical protein
MNNNNNNSAPVPAFVEAIRNLQAQGRPVPMNLVLAAQRFERGLK